MLMPTTTGTLSYSEVAAACDCAASTPRSWLLHDGHLSVPDDDTRPRLRALVEQHVGAGAAATLSNAWSTLLADDAPTLDAGDGTAGATATADEGLTTDERRLIVDQAILLLTEAYAHLPFKRSLHAVDPVQRLRLLDYRLSLEDDGARSDVDFHREMIDIFTTMRDLHTSYVVPGTYREAVALLPFRIEQFFEPGDDGPQPRYVASKVDDDATPDGFVEGVSITHWNGVPIHRAIELLAERQAAGNHAAAFARALDSLTLRPLLSSIKPDEEWIDITYLDTSAAPATARFAWTHQNVPDDLLPDHLEVALGIDVQTHAVGTVRKAMYGRRGDDRWTRGDEERGRLTEKIKLGEHHLETFMPWSFRAHSAVDDAFGYIRVFSFDTRKPEEFIAEFGRLAGELPPDGLIVDVRGNPGGSIVAAEGVLQVLRDDPIRPVRAQFTTSPLLLRICERHPHPSGSVPLELQPWIRSLRQAVATGSTHSQGFPITAADVLDRVEHRYLGPVVLIVDALCYSATDMFAAGFADHEIGAIIGVGDNTGAGGANVWRHSDLLRLAGDDDDLRPLPDGIDFRVAVRRTTRVHAHEGEILEDLGIEISERHHTTRADIFEGNRDLIAAAARLLTS